MNTENATTRRTAAPTAPSDLSANAVQDISGALTTLPTDLFALYLKTKNFHWHMSGPQGVAVMALKANPTPGSTLPTPKDYTLILIDFQSHISEAIGTAILLRKPLWKAVAFAAGLGLSMLSYPVHAAPGSGGDTVQALYDALLNSMRNGRTLGQSGRFTQLAPVIHRTFDIASMARLSVGPSWAGLTEAQHQQVTESFGRYISANYADRFDSYDGQKLEVTGEQPAPSGVMVRSQIVKANGEPVKVDYMMRRSGDNWLISDIYLDGAISEVATRRSEFAAILKSDGIDGLIAALNRKADVLTATTARSF